MSCGFNLFLLLRYGGKKPPFNVNYPDIYGPSSPVR